MISTEYHDFRHRFDGQRFQRRRTQIEVGTERVECSHAEHRNTIRTTGGNGRRDVIQRRVRGLRCDETTGKGVLEKRGVGVQKNMEPGDMEGVKRRKCGGLRMEGKNT